MDPTHKHDYFYDVMNASYAMNDDEYDQKKYFEILSSWTEDNQLDHNSLIGHKSKAVSAMPLKKEEGAETDFQEKQAFTYPTGLIENVTLNLCLEKFCNKKKINEPEFLNDH